MRSATAPGPRRHCVDLDIGSFSQPAVILASGDLGEFHCDSNFNISEKGDIARRADCN